MKLGQVSGNLWVPQSGVLGSATPRIGLAVPLVVWFREKHGFPTAGHKRRVGNSSQALGKFAFTRQIMALAGAGRGREGIPIKEFVVI